MSKLETTDAAADQNKIMGLQAQVKTMQKTINEQEKVFNVLVSGGFLNAETLEAAKSFIWAEC